MESNQTSLANANMARDISSQDSIDTQLLALQKEFGIVDEKGNNTVKTDEDGTPLKVDPEVAEVEKYLGMKLETPEQASGLKPPPKAESGTIAQNHKNNSLVQAVGGLAEAAQNTLNFGMEVADVITNKIGAENLISESNRFTFADENFPKSDQFGANAVRATSQFLTLFIPGNQAAGAARLTGAAAVARSAAAGLAADVLAFKGNEGRLNDLLKDTPFGDIAIPYLATNKTDSELEGRLKNGIEGLGLGVLGDAAFKGLKALRSMRDTRAALKVAREVESGVVKEATSSVKETPSVAQTTGTKVEPQAPLVGQDVAQLPGQSVDEVVANTPKNPLEKTNPEFFTKLDVKPEDITSGKISAADLEKSGGYKINLNKIDSSEQVLNAIKNTAELDKTALTTRTRGKIPNAELSALADETGVSLESLLQKKVGETFNAEELTRAREFHAAAANDLSEKAALATAEPTPENLVAFMESVNGFKAINYTITGAKAEAGRALQALKIKVSGLGKDPEVLKEILNLSGEKDIKQMAYALSNVSSDKLGKIINKSTHKKVVEAVLESYRNTLLSNPKTHVINFVSNATTFAQTVLERGIAGRIKSTGSIVAQDGLKVAVETRRKLLSIDKSTITHAQSESIASELARANAVIKKSLTSSIEPGEATQQMLGAFQGIMEGFQALKNSATEGFSSGGSLGSKIKATGEAARKNFADLAATTEMGASKFEGSSQGYIPAISSDAAGVASDGMVGKTIDMLGGVTRLPGNGLAWADDFWKYVNYRAETSAQLHNMTKKLGLVGDEAKAYAKEFLENPPDYVAEKAKGSASINTFTNDPEGFAKRIEDAVNTDIFGAPYVRFVVPFIRAPLNIAAFGVERTPIAMLMKTYKADIAAGGAAAQLAKSRVRTGSTIIAGLGIMSMQGLVTGAGPSDPRAQRQLKDTGWQPYSLKIEGENGTTFIPLNKLEPFGSFVGLAADLADAVNAQIDDGPDTSQLASSLTLAMAHLFTPEQLVDSVGDLMNALKGDPYSIRKYMTDIPAKSIPGIGLVNNVRKLTDPLARMSDNKDADGVIGTLREMMSKIQNQIPGMSSSLPPKLNIFGEAMPHVPGFGSTLSPFATTTIDKNDVVTKELISLGYSPTFKQGEGLPEGEKHLAIDFPQKSIKFENGMVNLDVPQYAKYVELAAGKGLKPQYQPYPGKTMKEALADVINSKYQMLGTQVTDQNKRSVLKTIITVYRTAARAQMLEEFPELNEKLNKSRQSFINARTSNPDPEGEE